MQHLNTPNTFTPEHPKGARISSMRKTNCCRNRRGGCGSHGAFTTTTLPPPCWHCSPCRPAKDGHSKLIYPYIHICMNLSNYIVQNTIISKLISIHIEILYKYNTNTNLNLNYMVWYGMKNNNQLCFVFVFVLCSPHLNDNMIHRHHGNHRI